MSDIVRIVLALCPVFAFLVALVFMDSFKLVRYRLVIYAILAGGAAAILAYYTNATLVERLTLTSQTFSRYIAPIVEETLKALFLVFLIRTRRVGFAVDAAIYGFAVGAGFAFAENIYYLQATGDAPLLTWVVRGFGTAAMHGGTVCIFGIISQTLTDRWSKGGPLPFLPGLAVAILIHSIFNHFILPPVMSTALLLVVFPIIIAVVFYQSERATQHWLGTGLDSDMELLELIVSGRVSDTHIGTYLENLRHHFPFEVLVDMLCYLRLHLELALQAKGLLMLRQAGLPIPPDPELVERFTELQHLEKSIGQTGKLAIMPFLKTSRRDMWQIYMLAQESVEKSAVA